MREPRGAAGTSSVDSGAVDSGAVDSGAVDSGAVDSAACDPEALCASGELEALAPRVLLLVDRSGSMTYSFGAGESRWEALTQALADPQKGVIPRFEDDVDFALSFFTYRGPEIASCQVLSELCLGDYQQAFVDHPPILDGQTPTAEALQQAEALLSAPLSGSQSGGSASAPSGPGSVVPGANPPSRQPPRAVILATDGMPDSCVDQKVDTDGSPAAQRAVALNVVRQVELLFAAGVRTYVVGVGADVQRAHLQDLANAGVGYDADAGVGQPGAVFQVGDSDALRAAFDDHVSTLRSCSFALDRSVSDVSRALVTLDGRELAWGSEWQLDGADRILLIGAACAQLKVAGGSVRATIPCGCE